MSLSYMKHQYESFHSLIKRHISKAL